MMNPLLFLPQIGNALAPPGGMQADTIFPDSPYMRPPNPQRWKEYEDDANKYYELLPPPNGLPPLDSPDGKEWFGESGRMLNKLGLYYQDESGQWRTRPYGPWKDDHPNGGYRIIIPRGKPGA